MIDKRTLILGALLHDIGKALLGKDRDGFYNLHIHPNDSNVDKKREELSEKLHFLDRNSFIWHSISYHHEPDQSIYKDFIKKYLQIADFASTIVRSEEERFSSDHRLRIVYPWALIRTIISKVENENYYLKEPIILPELPKNEDILPIGEPPELNTYRKEWYEKYQNMFLKELEEAVKTEDPDIVLAVLYKWLYFYPEDVHSGSINLFSLSFHLKTTAMLADLLYEIDKNKKSVYLVTLDLVGTHKAITTLIKKKKELYTEEEKYLKKINSLSIFVDVLTAIVTRYILSKADSYTTNILYIAGSSSKLVVALEDSKIKEIERFIDELNKELFRKTMGNLFVLADFKKIDLNIPHEINIEFAKELLKKIVDKFVESDPKTITEKKMKLFVKYARALTQSSNEITARDIIESSIQFVNEIVEKFAKEDIGIKIIITDDLSDILNIFSNKNEDEMNICIASYEDLFDNNKSIDILSNLEKLEEYRKIFLFFKSGRLQGVSVDDIEEIKRTKRLGYLKVDGDKVGLLFSKLLNDLEKDIENRFAIDEQGTKIITPLLKLRLSELLLFMFKYVLLRKADEKKEKEGGKYKKAVSIVYNSGDEFFAIGDIESLIEFYNEFLNTKEKLLGNILKTSAAFVYSYYKYPFGFVYEQVKDLPDIVKSEKLKIGNKSLNSLKEYVNLEDGIYFLEEAIIGKEEWKTYHEIIKTIIDDLKESKRDGRFSRTRIANIRAILDKCIYEIKDNEYKSIIYLIYYAFKSEDSREDTSNYEEDTWKRKMIEDIKNNYKEILKYLKIWKCLLDVLSVTRK